MRIKRLVLRNFMAHREAEVEFAERGFNVIFGPNGAGKTSLLRAIHFALFHNRGRGIGARNPSQLVRAGSREGSVMLEFSEDGKTYRVERYMGPGSGARLVEDNRQAAVGPRNVTPKLIEILGMTPEAAAYSMIAYQGYLEGLLAIPQGDREKIIQRIFRITSLILLRDLLREYQSGIEKQIEGVSGELRALGPRREAEARLREIESEIANVRKKEAEAKGRLARLRAKEAELSALELSLVSEINELEGVLGARRELERELEARRGELGRVEEKLAGMPSREELEAKKRELEETKLKLGSLALLKERLAELEKSLSEALRARDVVRELGGVEEELESVRREERELRSRVRELAERKGALRALKETLSKLEARIGEIEGELGDLGEVPASKEVEARLRELASRMGAAEQEKARLKSYLANMESLGDRCPLCGTPLGPEHRDRLRSEIEGRLRELGEEARLLEAEERSLRDALARAKRAEELEAERKDRLNERGNVLGRLAGAQEAEEALAKAEARLRELEPVREALEAKALRLRRAKDLLARVSPDELEAQIKNVRREIEALGPLEGDPKAIERELRAVEGLLARRVGLEARREALVKDIGETEHKLAAMAKVSPEELEAKKRELAHNRKELEKIRGEVGGLRAELGRLAEALGVLERERQEKAKVLNHIAEREERLTLLEGRHSLAKRITQGLGSPGIRDFFRKEIVPAVERLTREWFGRFGFSHFADLRLDHVLTPTLITPDGNERSYDQLSGGERVCLALALRMALAQQLVQARGRKPELLILDEPTVHLDEERRQELMEMMRELKEYSLDGFQIILITHHQEFRAMADRVIELERIGPGRVRIVVQ